MATDLMDKPQTEIHQQLELDNNGDDVVIEFPAPLGWTKKFIPKKSGTPRRNEIVFIAPSGEEIKNKRQLDIYLKSHPGGPSASEFDWGTGDTPRRSVRLSSRPKATETPESTPSSKRQKRSRSKKEEDKKDGTDGEKELTGEEAAADKTENAEDVEMKDVDHSQEDAAKETVDASAKASQEGNAKALEEPLPDDKEEQMEKKEAGTDEKQAAVEVPQETVPSKGDEQPNKIRPEAVVDAVEKQPGEVNEVCNNATGEQPADSKETSNNLMEEQPMESKEAQHNAAKEVYGENKLASDDASKEKPTEANDVNKATLANAGTGTGTDGST